MKTSSQQTLKGEVSLARWTGNGTQGWRLTIEDRASHLRVAEVSLTDQQLGELLGGRIADVDVGHWASPNIGKRMEVANIVVPGLTRDTWSGRDHIARQAMEAQDYFHGDGWAHQVDETFNFHRSTPEGYRVTLRRWVAE